MYITLKGRIVKALAEELAPFHLEFETDGRNAYRDQELKLGEYSSAEVTRLADLFQNSGVAGTKVVAADIRKYLKAASEGLDGVTARTVRQAAWLLEHYVAGLPHHMIFTEDRHRGGSHVGYYVNDISYEMEKHSGRYDRYEPPRVFVELAYVDLEHVKRTSFRLGAAGVLNLTPREILKKAGYVPESPERMRVLKDETERFHATCDLIGKKYMARGIGALDIDDDSDKPENFLWNRRGTVVLDNFDLQTPVVVDVLEEKDTKNEREGADEHVNLYRWHKWNMRFFTESEDEVARRLEADEDTDLAPDIQVPVHPLVPCFDLKRHVRLRCHLNNLTPYAYDRKVMENLVLPERDVRMINLLVDESQNTFRDVVGGKGASMNILSEGNPGTGKTVTAEVFAEFKERPLYSVQCSQLGMEPAEVEKNLTVILTRANRWNAVLLLDEADVYIRKRGRNMKHNAVVGVFLRILEYASCILFMTTNLADNVDDAVASRCIVRLRYGAPSESDQVRIWHNLARLNGIKLVARTAEKFAAAHPDLTGRDVKNLLKLVSFVCKADGKPIGAEALEFALQFKPTEKKR